MNMNEKILEGAARLNYLIGLLDDKPDYQQELRGRLQELLILNIMPGEGGIANALYPIYELSYMIKEHPRVSGLQESEFLRILTFIVRSRLERSCEQQATFRVNNLPEPNFELDNDPDFEWY